jgi:hypothetical protein
MSTRIFVDLAEIDVILTVRFVFWKVDCAASTNDFVKSELRFPLRPSMGRSPTPRETA